MMVLIVMMMMLGKKKVSAFFPGNSIIGDRWLVNFYRHSPSCKCSKQSICISLFCILYFSICILYFSILYLFVSSRAVSLSLEWFVYKLVGILRIMHRWGWVDAHANSKYLNWFLDSCLSWNWTISCALFAIEKLTLELFSIILGLKIWSCNCFQRLRFTVSPYTCYWKFCCFDITNRESLWMFSNSESSSLVLWFSGSLVLWFILVLQNCL